MLQAFGLAFEPDPRIGPLFENLNLSVAPGERVGLIGRNGVGKTKLLEILGGLLEPDAGHVVRSGTIGYLPQDFDLAFDGTLSELLGDNPELRRILPRLGIDRLMQERHYQTLSLGERTRAHLALALREDPDFLLLDEPTNHLDVEGRQWLERTLTHCRQGVLLVTHDRTTLDSVVDRIVELEDGGIQEFTGGYSELVAHRAHQRERQREAFERQRKEARRLLVAAEETLKRSKEVAKPPSKGTYDPKHSPYYIAKAGRMDKRAQAIRSRVEQARATFVDKPFDEQATELVFPCRPLRHPTALAVRRLGKRFSSTVFQDLNLTVERGARIAIAGKNGAGKTTLFRILLGEETADSGTIEWAPDAVAAYLSQERSQLPFDRTILEAIDPQGRDEETFVRTLLARLHMRREDVHTPVGKLSVGERTKAEIVSLLTSPANVLLLDEPTNHLDIPSMEALEEALVSFPGSILFASHDRSFVERIATEVVML